VNSKSAQTLTQAVAIPILIAAAYLLSVLCASLMAETCS
jgi:hypothetical protein